MQNFHDISQNIAIYRIFNDMFWYIGDISAIYRRHIVIIFSKYRKNILRYRQIYRDILLDISRYPDISFIFDKFADTNSLFEY